MGERSTILLLTGSSRQKKINGLPKAAFDSGFPRQQNPSQDAAGYSGCILPSRLEREVKLKSCSEVKRRKGMFDELLGSIRHGASDTGLSSAQCSGDAQRDFFERQPHRERDAQPARDARQGVSLEPADRPVDAVDGSGVAAGAGGLPASPGELGAGGSGRRAGKCIRSL